MLRRLAVLAFLSAAPALASAQTITIAESNDQDQTINIAECNNTAQDTISFQWTVATTTLRLEHLGLPDRVLDQQQQRGHDVHCDGHQRNGHHRVVLGWADGGSAAPEHRDPVVHQRDHRHLLLCLRARHSGYGDGRAGDRQPEGRPARPPRPDDHQHHAG